MYSILLNGSSFGNNIPSRGLRQRDPLSPYLFILGAEVLSRLFIRAEKESLISGIKVAKRAPGISHLFFVDDIFIFTGAIIQEAREIKEILEEYCEVSGQMINFNKSATSFSKGACRNRCKTIISILGVRSLLDNETYQSNPLNVGRNKGRTFQPTVDKVKNKIQSCQIPLLSQAGRNALTKYITSAIPVYSMSVLRFLKGLRRILTGSSGVFGGEILQERKVPIVLNGRTSVNLLRVEG